MWILYRDWNGGDKEIRPCVFAVSTVVSIEGCDGNDMRFFGCYPFWPWYKPCQSCEPYQAHQRLCRYDDSNDGDMMTMIDHDRRKNSMLAKSTSIFTITSHVPWSKVWFSYPYEKPSLTMQTIITSTSSILQ